jgi:alcohol dehydrogenase class IV
MVQQYYMGEQSIVNLETVLKRIVPNNIFLVTGKKSYETSGAKYKMENILRNYVYTRFFDFAENPRYEDVKKGLDVFDKTKHDLIIAVGGGSVLDMAKLINIVSVYPIERIMQNKIDIDDSRLKSLIAIPTTAGSGSEATHFSVMYRDKIKYSIAHPALQPQIAIIDPVFTYNSPQYLSACCSFDALSQAIESYWNLHYTEESTLYAQKAIELIGNTILKGALENDKESKNALAEGAYWAGRAINITKTTAAHALSYPLTMHYAYPHGHAVAVFLPEVFRFNMAAIFEKAEDKMVQRMENLCRLLGADNFNQAYLNLLSYREKLGLSLTEEQKGKIEASWIIENVNIERLENNPIKLGHEDINQIIQQVLVRKERAK